MVARVPAAILSVGGDLPLTYWMRTTQSLYPLGSVKPKSCAHLSAARPLSENPEMTTPTYF